MKKLSPLAKGVFFAVFYFIVNVGMDTFHDKVVDQSVITGHLIVGCGTGILMYFLFRRLAKDQ